MSVLSSLGDTPGRSDDAEEFHRHFLTHVHTILKLGYDRLITAESDLCKAEEEDITGEFAKAMNAVLASPETPAWRTFYAVHEEPRVWNPRRRGKRRLRLDIQVEFTGESRPRFSFEAKRLRSDDKKSIIKYFGKEGLGCFIKGVYAGESDEAGMLAYIQSQDLSHWSSKIHSWLKKRAMTCEWIAELGWTSVGLAEGLDTTYKSVHTRSFSENSRKDIIVYHTLLVFVSAMPD